VKDRWPPTATRAARRIWLKKKKRRACVDRSSLINQFTQSQPRKRSLAAAADEFAADAMARIMPRFMNRYRHIALPQSYAECQAARPRRQSRWVQP